MTINVMLKPKPAERYRDLTNGGSYNVNLNQEEACVVLKIHDYGVDTLSSGEKGILHSIIGKLKDEVWP